MTIQRRMFAMVTSVQAGRGPVSFNRLREATYPLLSLSQISRRSPTGSRVPSPSGS